MKRIAYLLSILTAAGFLQAQTGTTRLVTLSWTASVSTGITGYTISTGSSAAGPFVQVGCTGTVPGSTCVSGSTSTTSAYNDVETIGNTVWYQVVAVAAPCTSTTPVTTPCGISQPAGTSTTIPARPAITTVVVVVQ